MHTASTHLCCQLSIAEGLQTDRCCAESLCTLDGMSLPLALLNCASFAAHLCLRNLVHSSKCRHMHLASTSHHSTGIDGGFSQQVLVTMQ